MVASINYIYVFRCGHGLKSLVLPTKALQLILADSIFTHTGPSAQLADIFNFHTYKGPMVHSKYHTQKGWQAQAVLAISKKSTIFT